MNAFDQVRKQVEFDPSLKFQWKQPKVDEAEQERILDYDLLARIEETFKVDIQ